MQLALTVAGAAIGWQIGGPQGAAIGASIGSSAGAYFFGPEIPDIQGPRLSDLKVQTSTFGAPIPIVYGAYRLTGNVIYSTDIIETRKDEEVGGKGGPSATQTTYSYSVYCAVGICEGPVDGVRRIWANGKLIYNADTGLIDSDIGDMRIYLGGEDQEPDPYWQGVYTDVPAHRGLVYVAFDNLQLATFGNRIPNFSFEIYPTITTYWFSKTYLNNGYSQFYPKSIYRDTQFIYSAGMIYLEDINKELPYILKQNINGNLIKLIYLNNEDYTFRQIQIKNNYIYLTYNTIGLSGILKLDLNFNIVWFKSFDIGITNTFYFVFDLDGNICCFGKGNYFYFVKLDIDGNTIFSKSYTNLGSSFPSLMPNGNILITKQAFNSPAISCIDTDGNVIFSKQITGFNIVNAISDINNNIYVAYTQVSPTYYRVIAKLDSEGNHIETNRIDATEIGKTNQTSILLNDAQYNLYGAGFTNRQDYYNYEQTFIKFNSSFNIEWSKKTYNIGSDAVLEIKNNLLSFTTYGYDEEYNSFLTNASLSPEGNNIFGGYEYYDIELSVVSDSTSLFDITSEEVETDLIIDNNTGEFVDILIDGFTHDIYLVT